MTKQFESYCNYPIFVQKKMSRRMTCCARLSEDEKAVRRPDKKEKRIPAAFIEAISQNCIV